MSAAYFAKMIEVTLWADNELFARVEQMTPQQLHHNFSYSMGTLMMQTAHLVEVQYWWFHFLNSGEYIYFDPRDIQTMQDLRPYIDEGHQLLRSYAARLTDAELARMVKPKFWTPDTAPWPVWEAIHQVVNHSTDHRAQALAFLHQLGGQTFQQDYLFYERPELMEE
jgi:uncharacterized damage-inducible protein DinB